MLKNSPLVKKFDYCGACTLYLGAIIITLICQALAGIASAALSNAVPDIAENADFLTAFMIFIQIASAAFVLLFCMRSGYRLDCAIVKTPKSDKVEWQTFAVPVAGAALLLFAMYLPTVWYGYFAVYALHVPPNAGQINLNTSSSVAMIVIASVFFAPAVEETIYRGVLFNGLKKSHTVVKAILLSALSFMLMHMSPVQVVFQFSLGAVSAYIMHRSGRLLPCVIFHATANALALVMQLTPLSAELLGMELWLTENIAAAVFITLAAAGVGGALLFALIKFAFGKPRAELVPPPIEKDLAHDPDKVQGGVAVISDEISAAARKKDGTMRYIIGVGISIVMLIINFVTMVVG